MYFIELEVVMVNILVCDDDKEIAGALEIYLRNEGYNVFKAYDGMEALNIVKKNRIHLILMDVMMPNLDGIQATMKIREENNIPIIMLSAKSEDYDGELIPVTPTEFGILKLLTQNAGKVFSIEQIYESVWNESAYNPENTVAVHIRRIREKIEINPKNPKYLKVVWGIGYKVEKL